MRKFYLQNEYGEKLELQNGSVFFWEPSGLGFEEDITYMESGGFFIETSRQTAQLQKTGTLVFKPNAAYRNYREFADWIFTAKKLTLAYSPAGEWYYIDVDILRIEKNELDIYGLLKCPIVFIPKSPWYAPYNLNLTIDGTIPDDSKQYAYAYPYRYAKVSQGGVLDVTVNAQTDSAFTLAIAGPVSAPVLTVARQDTGAIIGKVDLSAASVSMGETLRYSTVPQQTGAMLESSGINTDISQLIGISAQYPAFFQLPPGVPLRFTLEAASLTGVTAVVNIYRYYRSV